MSDKIHKDQINRLAKNSKRLREGLGLTQEDMHDLGFNVRHYQRIEAGDSAVNTRTIAKLCAAFDADILDLFKPVKKT